ncbi:hypothetical protein FIU94_07870 [Sulfitobacter sp. THAF37]|nr:hypothetical protein FIU94_07870 [Sulfitobacter sp. THAF37]
MPKEQPPRKLSGTGTVPDTDTLESGAKRIRRRDNDLRRKDRGGILDRNVRGKDAVLLHLDNRQEEEVPRRWTI